MPMLRLAFDAITVRPGPLWIAGLGSALLTGLLCAWISGDARETASPHNRGAAVLLAPVYLVLA